MKKRITPTKINVFAQYLLRVRRNLHVVLCMSPMGEAFRNRVRMFPALVNCCTINWFSEWPEDALKSVAAESLSAADKGGKGDSRDLALGDQLPGVVDFFRATHTAVATASRRYLDTLRRYNYVTPTSYLELLSTFKTVLNRKRDEVGLLRTRLQTGLDKITSTEAVVSKLQEELVAMQPVLEATQREVSEMLVALDKDRAAAAETRAVVERDQAKALEETAETNRIKEDAQADLDKALPALAEAVACLERLKKSDIDELRALKQPPRLVKLTLEAACVMFGIKPKLVVDPANPVGKKLKDYWGAALVTLLSDAKKLVSVRGPRPPAAAVACSACCSLPCRSRTPSWPPHAPHSNPNPPRPLPLCASQDLKDFDKDNIPDAVIDEVKPYVDDPEFVFDTVDKASKACSSA